MVMVLMLFTCDAIGGEQGGDGNLVHGITTSGVFSKSPEYT